MVYYHNTMPAYVIALYGQIPQSLGSALPIDLRALWLLGHYRVCRLGDIMIMGLRWLATGPLSKVLFYTGFILFKLWLATLTLMVKNSYK